MPSDRLEFLSLEWCERLNDVLSARRRPVATPESDARARVTVTDVPRAPDIQLELMATDRLPAMTRLEDGRARARGPVDAKIRLPHALLRTVLLDGDFEAAHRGFEEGTVTYTGSRRVVLY